jgi:hypothetical protein
MERLRKKSRFFVFLLGLPSFLWADQLKLSNGRIYEGAIVMADNRSVSIQISDTQQVKIPHSLISEVFFRYADQVYLLSGEMIKCKVLDEKLPNLHIVTEKGSQQIKISDLKRYFYNESDSLTLTALPPTALVFNNKKSLDLMETKMDRAVFISLSGGILTVPGQTWSENFVTASSLLGLIGQIQVGFNLHRNLAVYAGYLRGQYNNTAEGDLVSEIQTAYIHLGIIYSHAFDFLPGAGFSISGDIGLLNLSGNLYTYSYRNLSLDDVEANIAGRMMIGVHTFLKPQLAVYLKTGYFFAQKFVVNVPAATVYQISIPLNGWTVLGGFSFYIPI